MSAFFIHNFYFISYILDSLLYDEKGYPRPEGTNINIKLKRNGKSILLPYKIEYKERKYKYINLIINSILLLILNNNLLIKTLVNYFNNKIQLQEQDSQNQSY